MENQSNFQILIGGQNPEEIKKINMENLNSDEELPEVKKQIESNNVIMDHFLNCKWNSGKQLRKTQGCCSSAPQETVMYFCDLLQIESLQPLICERCTKFQNREENKE
jgi:hypothetical protein